MVAKAEPHKMAYANACKLLLKLSPAKILAGTTKTFLRERYKRVIVVQIISFS